MKNSLFSIFAAVLLALTIGFTSCQEQNPIAKSYADSAELTSKPAAWSQSQPQLVNKSDSASYLMCYIFGGNLNRMIDTNRIPELKNINRTDFERGVAMVLQADSSQLDLLYGIMFAVSLRQNLNQISETHNIDWNSTLTYRGFYQGFNNTIPHDLPLPMAEMDLTSILYPDMENGQEIDF